MLDYTIVSGDCLSSVARRFGFADVTVHGPVPLGRGEAVSALASARVRKAEERARVVRGGRIGRLR